LQAKKYPGESTVRLEQNVRSRDLKKAMELKHNERVLDVWMEIVGSMFR